MPSINISAAVFLCISLSFCIADDLFPKNIVWSCAKNVTGFQYDVEKISGNWYEVARLPASEIPACVNVTAPSAPKNSKYTLQLQFVDNSNGWELKNEELAFPWNNDTQHGVFKLKYGSTEVNFKLINTDYESVALVCGYSPIASDMSLVKVMSRVPQVGPNIKDIVEKMADKYNVSQHITWVEFSDRCNDGVAKGISALLLLSAIIFSFLQFSN